MANKKTRIPRTPELKRLVVARIEQTGQVATPAMTEAVFEELEGCARREMAKLVEGALAGEPPEVIQRLDPDSVARTIYDTMRSRRSKRTVAAP